MKRAVFSTIVTVLMAGTATVAGATIGMSKWSCKGAMGFMSSSYGFTCQKTFTPYGGEKE